MNRLPNVTHPMSIGSAAKRADRRRDPTPINNFGNFRTYGCHLVSARERAMRPQCLVLRSVRI